MINTTAPQESNESIYNQSGQTQAEEKEDSKQEEKVAELTLPSVVNKMEEERGLVKMLMSNLAHYSNVVKAKVTSDASLLQESDRKKMFFAN